MEAVGKRQLARLRTFHYEAIDGRGSMAATPGIERLRASSPALFTHHERQ